jgi:hypothetical protein
MAGDGRRWRVHTVDAQHFVQLTGVHAQFERKQVFWDIIRALPCTPAFGCLAWALDLHGKEGLKWPTKTSP